MPILLILFVIMFGLKIASVGMAATLSWWIVTLPLWIIPAIFIGTFVVVGGIGAVAIAASSLWDLIASTLKQRRLIKESRKEAGQANLKSRSK